MGTAPLNPTHDTKLLERNVIFLNGARLRKTLTGRPIRIINTPIRSDTGATASISWGLTNRPSIRKTTICASHVRPSMNFDTDRLPGI